MKKLLWLKKVKITLPLTYAIKDICEEEIFEIFYEKELQKTNQAKFRVEKVKKNVINWEVYDN